MIFNGLQGLTIPEGVVTQIAKDGVVLWAVQSDKPIILEVEKITSNTYAGETTYSNEQFILLDIYPKTNGTVSVTYGGLTKTVTDTSGASEPNAHQVFFGTFNGVSDNTPASGELTIEGDCYAFGCSTFNYSSKSGSSSVCPCICSVSNFGNVDRLPMSCFNGLIILSPIESKFNQTNMKIPSTIKSIGGNSFVGCTSLVSVELNDGLETIGALAFNGCTNLVSITIPKSVTYIGANAFADIKSIKMLGTTPPEAPITTLDGVEHSFTSAPTSSYFILEQIIVPKGCGNIYKTATGWSIYADYIVEVS